MHRYGSNASNNMTKQGNLGAHKIKCPETNLKVMEDGDLDIRIEDCNYQEISMIYKKTQKGSSMTN